MSLEAYLLHVTRSENRARHTEVCRRFDRLEQAMELFMDIVKTLTDKVLDAGTKLDAAVAVIDHAADVMLNLRGKLAGMLVVPSTENVQSVIDDLDGHLKNFGAHLDALKAKADAPDPQPVATDPTPAPAPAPQPEPAPAPQQEPTPAPAPAPAPEPAPVVAVDPATPAAS